MAIKFFLAELFIKSTRGGGQIMGLEEDNIVVNCRKCLNDRGSGPPPLFKKLVLEICTKM